MKKVIFAFLILILVANVLAHQPRYVMPVESSAENPIIISDIEISQAFYGDLNGKPDYYKTSMIDGKSFNFYIQMLVPDLPDSRKDFLFEISQNNETRNLSGESFNWTPFYEEFAGDNYLSGPEIEFGASGEYLVKVSNSENAGKYVLVVGKAERFSVKDLAVLPLIKKNFFDKSYFSAFQGIIGNSFFVMLIFILATVLIIYRHIKIKKRKNTEN